jgi:hypothetical protein
VLVLVQDGFEILIRGAVIADGTESQKITFLTAEGEPTSATFLKFEQTDLSDSLLRHVRMRFAEEAIRVGDESEFDQAPIENSGSLVASIIELWNTRVATDGYNTQAKLFLNSAHIVESEVMGYYPRSEPIQIRNSTIVNSQVFSDDYNKGITLEKSVANNTDFQVGCCGATLFFDNSSAFSSYVRQTNDDPTVYINKSEFNGVPFCLPNAIPLVSDTVFVFTDAATDADVDTDGDSDSDTDTDVSCGNGVAMEFDSLKMQYSTVTGNENLVGIELHYWESNDPAVITYCDINNFTTGIRLMNSSGLFTMSNSNLWDNSAYNIENIRVDGATATNNYWGTSDEAEIKNKILDMYDDLNYGEVTYDPYLTSPQEDTGPR